MIVPGSANSLLLAQGATTPAYNLTKSLRFRSSASAYMNRTPSSATNRKTWTWSAWIKRGSLGVLQTLFSAYNADSDSGYTEIRLLSTDTLVFSGFTTNWRITTQVFRDPASWYHIVVALDTTQATASNRIKMYVNGSEITSFGTSNNPSQNSDLAINLNATHSLGRLQSSASQYFDGYMAEINFIDGQALTPSSFGENNATTGVWQPKQYTGTYGTNGFYLPFTNTTSTTTLGYDSSGNSNNWTTNNFSLTAGVTYDSMTDVPTLTSATAANYCVINALNLGAASSASNGNLTVTTGLATSTNVGTIQIPTTGKWYWEYTGTTNGDYAYCGVTNTTTNTLAYYANDGKKYINGTGTTYGATYTTNDVIGVAVDADGGTVTFYKNNVSQGAITYTTSDKLVYPYFADGSGSFSAVINANFGQQGFKYTPPTGYVALNTYNLPTSTIVKGNTVMDATTYTGTGASLSVTNAGFKPDLVWIKSRSAATDHKLTDSVRGTTKALISDTTGAETTDANGLTAFGTSGFTVGTDTVYNNNTATYVGWQWQAGQGTTSSNTSGSITSTVSVNPTAGFSIVSWTAPNSGTSGTIGHGLGVAPAMYIVKYRQTSTTWRVYHSTLGAGQFLTLNTTDATTASSTVWNNTSPTSSVFSVGSNYVPDASLNQMITYCWAQVAGFSQFGSYTGNGSADGPFIYTGFRPKYVMVKCSSSSQAGNAAWYILDSARNTYNVENANLYADLSNAEGAADRLDFVSNGFKIRTTSTGFNASSATYIYAAFAENPFKNALAR